jgi:hypothetical protein
VIVSLWEFSELEVVAVVFAVSGVVLAVTLHLFVRASPRPPPFASRRAPRPQPLELVRQEGFELIELYDDEKPVPAPPVFPAKEAVPSPARPVVRTAKVLDPVSGEVRLLRVLTPSQAPR